MNENVGASFGLSVLTVVFFAVLLYQPDEPVDPAHEVPSRASASPSVESGSSVTPEEAHPPEAMPELTPIVMPDPATAPAEASPVAERVEPASSEIQVSAPEPFLPETPPPPAPPVASPTVNVSSTSPPPFPVAAPSSAPAPEPAAPLAPPPVSEPRSVAAPPPTPSPARPSRPGPTTVPTPVPTARPAPKPLAPPRAREVAQTAAARPKPALAAESAPRRPRGAFTHSREKESLVDVAIRVYGTADQVDLLWRANRDSLRTPDSPLDAGTLLRTP